MDYASTLRMLSQTVEEHQDEMQERWGADYNEYLAECKETGEKPMSFTDFWKECEADL